MSYTASGLVDYVKKALKMNTVYMWGGIMRLVTESYISGRANQYPSWYTPARVAKFRALIGKDYYGVDCVGLIKSYYWGGVGSKNYKAETDKSANGMFQAATEKGPINTLPEIPGVCVWLDGHIGVYIGNGLVIESTNNTRFGGGVCQTKLSDRNWTHWLKCPYIEYEDQSPSDGPKATVGTEEPGNTGEPPAKTYKTYTVKKGDSLWAIAQKELGNGSRWPEIQKLNGLSGTTIYAGQVLKIPV